MILALQILWAVGILTMTTIVIVGNWKRRNRPYR